MTLRTKISLRKMIKNLIYFITLIILSKHSLLRRKCKCNCMDNIK